jgi:bifunctional non-homologous end joining protein LigD
MSSLSKYNQKRDFTQTSEPAGKIENAKTQRLEFVVQKHDASHLHYDFRLEMDGVLKSWAVPKGPSLNPHDKRLAMMTEDHPYDYRTFEGVIPEGNYGAGEVIVWDNGTYEMVNDEHGQPKDPIGYLEKGHLDFVLHGKKLKGRFALVKKGKEYEGNAWLLIKKKDQFATDDDITEQVQSVASDSVLSRDKSVGRHDLTDAPEAPIPKVVKPMLATLVGEAFDDEDWLYEIKWDGYRAIGSWDGRREALYSRNNIDFSAKYPAIYEALRELNHKVVLDGEIVVADSEGRSNFVWLQNYGREPKGTLLYYVFDILWCDGHDVRDWPLLKRKALLKEVLGDHERLRYSDHIQSKGKQFFAMTKERQLEGMMAKRCNSRYIEGFRSKNWLKIKTHLRQEVVIGGFTEPRGSRKHLGALVVGVYEDDKLKYVGHTGGGIPPKQLPELRKTLEGLEQSESPFSNKFKPNAPVHWVRPKLLAEVSFAQWTKDGHMRQPIFVGLRSDKPPEKVHQEKPEGVKVAKDKLDSRVKFTHKDKVFWPEKGYTKQGLLDYYLSVSDYILPYIKDRPESLLRQPNGYSGKSFFQKDAGGSLPDWAKTCSIYSESNQKEIEYFVAGNTEDLQLLVQLGCIEINPWSSRVNQLDKPDWAVIDLDPEGVEFKDVVRVALEVKKLCDEIKIPSYPKTSGKTGIHIFIPTGAKYTYDQIKTFAEILANIIQSRTADITSVERSPSKRQHKIYIDFLQNRKGQTLAAPYAVRPTLDASVSAPLDWSEVNGKLRPENFTIKNMSQRLKSIGDIWQPVMGRGIDIEKAIDNLS